MDRRTQRLFLLWSKVRDKFVSVWAATLAAPCQLYPGKHTRARPGYANVQVELSLGICQALSCWPSATSIYQSIINAAIVATTPAASLPHVRRLVTVHARACLPPLHPPSPRPIVPCSSPWFLGPAWAWVSLSYDEWVSFLRRPRITLLVSQVLSVGNF